MIVVDRACIGTWEWISETGGRLTAAERIRMVPALLGTFRSFVRDRIRLAASRRPRHGMSVEDLWPAAPDSLLTRHGEEEARELQSTAMLHHGYRTWIFGEALARIDRASLDPELFHVGSLLHDVGLEHIRENQCFTKKSAESAESVAHRGGLSADRTLEMMTGIVMHITPGLAHGDSPLGYYLQAGAMADLVGIRAWELPSELRRRATDLYPRADVHRVLSRCWHAEAKAVPGGRAHFADVYGGFSRIVRWFPTQ